MSTNLPSTEQDNAYIRLYSINILQARIFGAVLSAARYRKAECGSTQKSVADAMGRDEGAVSKLFARPSNMTIKTIAEICVALRVNLEFALVDQDDKYRVFLDVGTYRREIHPAQQIGSREAVETSDIFITAYVPSMAKSYVRGKSIQRKLEFGASSPLAHEVNHVSIVKDDEDA